jgi:hypothetical protein
MNQMIRADAIPHREPIAAVRLVSKSATADAANGARDFYEETVNWRHELVR